MSAALTLDELAVLAPPQKRVMGLDVGAKTIGLALSDVTRVVASPLDTIRRQKFSSDAARLLDLVREHDVCALIIGLPLNMDGSEGPRAQSSRSFGRNLARLEGFPQGLGLVFWDERLSTAAAERALLEADMSRKRRAAVIDKMAAAIILQGALDRLNVCLRQIRP